MNRKFWGILASLIVVGFVFFRLVVQSSPNGTAEDMREGLLGSSHQVDINLAVDIPKGRETENPSHQEIDASGNFDFHAQEGSLTYDFHDLNNSGGFLGHFDELEVLYAAESVYMEIFNSGPQWVRVQPDDIGTGDIERLQDIVLSSPVMLPAYLTVNPISQDLSGDELSRSIDPSVLAKFDQPYVAAVGEFLDGRTSKIDVTVISDGSSPERIVVTFDYNLELSGGAFITIAATFELEPSEGEDLNLPSSPEVRDYSSIFG